MMSTTGYVASRSREYMTAPKLPASTERELIHRWKQEGDVAARRALIEANMRHVVTIARKYRRYPVPFEDMLAEGALGLVIAIDRFDESKPVRLVTYASYWIRACVFQCIIKEWKRGKTGLGMTRSKTFFRIRRIRAAYKARYGVEGNHLVEMARELEVSTESLRDMLAYLDTHDLSMDSDWGNEDGERAGLHDRLAGDVAGPDHVAQRLQDLGRMRDAVEKALLCLDDRERLVASARLMRDDPRTLAELGKRMGVSRERARQIEVRAREKLGRALMRQGVDRDSFSGVAAY